LVRICIMTRSILTEDNVRFIRRAYETDRKLHASYGLFLRRTANEFNVSPKTIRDVIVFRTWKHVAFPITDEEAGLAESVAELKALDPFGVWLDCDYI